MAIRSSDQISIVDLTDGYSVILTNDSYTFAGSTSAATAGSTTTTVVAMCGATQVAASVNLDDVVKPAGVTVTKDTDATQPTLTIAVANTVTTGGVVDMRVSHCAVGEQDLRPGEQHAFQSRGGATVLRRGMR